jgi:hypothetical protein
MPDGEKSFEHDFGSEEKCQRLDALFRVVLRIVDEGAYRVSEGMAALENGFRVLSRFLQVRRAGSAEICVGTKAAAEVGVDLLLDFFLHCISCFRHLQLSMWPASRTHFSLHRCSLPKYLQILSQRTIFFLGAAIGSF